MYSCIWLSHAWFEVYTLAGYNSALHLDAMVITSLLYSAVLRKLIIDFLEGYMDYFTCREICSPAWINLNQEWELLHHWLIQLQLKYIQNEICVNNLDLPADRSSQNSLTQRGGFTCRYTCLSRYEPSILIGISCTNQLRTTLLASFTAKPYKVILAH